MGNGPSCNANMNTNVVGMLSLKRLTEEELKQYAEEIADFFKVRARTMDTEDVPDWAEIMAAVDPMSSPLAKNVEDAADATVSGMRNQRRMKKILMKIFQGKVYNAVDDVPLLSQYAYEMRAAYWTLIEALREFSANPKSGEGDAMRDALMIAYTKAKCGNPVSAESSDIDKAMQTLMYLKGKNPMRWVMVLTRYCTLLSLMRRALEEDDVSSLFKSQEAADRAATFVALEPKLRALLDKDALDSEALANMAGSLESLFEFVSGDDMTITGIARDVGAAKERLPEFRAACLALTAHTCPQSIVDRAFAGEDVPTAEIPAPATSEWVTKVKVRTEAADAQEGKFAMSWKVVMKAPFGGTFKTVLYLSADKDGGQFCVLKAGNTEVAAAGFCIATHDHALALISNLVRSDMDNKTKKAIKAKPDYVDVPRHFPEFVRAAYNSSEALGFGTVAEAEAACAAKIAAFDAWTEGRAKWPENEGEKTYTPESFGIQVRRGGMGGMGGMMGGMPGMMGGRGGGRGMSPMEMMMLMQSMGGE